jgi:hypothetical protein|tara:strand:+ start:463 stop:672 length:210 start_codon:yes stop_codon:yes gene_type:complete
MIKDLKIAELALRKDIKLAEKILKEIKEDYFASDNLMEVSKYNIKYEDYEKQRISNIIKIFTTIKDNKK